MSGRGGIPVKGLSPVLNAFFFSARMQIGRASFVKTLFDPRAISDPAYRRATKEAWKYFGTAMTGWMSIIVAGQQLGLWDAEVDPRSSDFGKIIIAGRVRIDVWGGYQQWFVLYARLLASLGEQVDLLEGNVKRVSTGEVVSADPQGLIAHTVQSKAAPLWNQALMLATGEDFKGEEIDRKNIKLWVDANLPFSIQAFMEGVGAFGTKGAFLGPISFTGMGADTYDIPRWKETDDYFRIAHADPNTERQMRRQYRVNNPELEAKLFIKKTISTLSTPEARIHMYKLMDQLKLDLKKYDLTAPTPDDTPRMKTFRDIMEKRKKESVAP